MAFADDIAGDYAIFDGGQTVTLIQKRGGGTNKRTIRNATNDPLSFSQVTALGGVGMIAGARSWSLNAADVGPDGVAATSDVIDDGTNTWQVIAATQTTLSNRWKCPARIQTPQT